MITFIKRLLHTIFGSKTTPKRRKPMKYMPVKKPKPGKGKKK